MIQHSYNTQQSAFTSTNCPIARIEEERRNSPMAMLVARTTQSPAFA